MNARLSGLGKDLQTRVKRFFDTTLDANATPLEICLAVLDDVERKVQPVGRGRKVFPYSRLVVRVRQPADDGAPLDAAFEGFEQRVRERLAELRCEPPSALDVRVTCVTDAPTDWAAGQVFAVEYAREPAAAPTLEPTSPPTPAAAASLRITVLKGATTEEVYTFTESTISIGRTIDPTDDLGRVRRNRVAFLDIVDGVTETVGRAHARLRFDAKTRECLVFDEGSSNGTAVIRAGAAIPVPAREPRGVKVRSGDEVQVGRAVLRIEIAEDPA